MNNQNQMNNGMTMPGGVPMHMNNMNMMQQAPGQMNMPNM